MATVTHKLVLKGAYAGQTIELCGVKFREGRAEITGGDDLAGLLRVLRRSYQAIPEGELDGEHSLDAERVERSVSEMDSEISSYGRTSKGSSDERTGHAGSSTGDSRLRPDGDGQGRSQAEQAKVQTALSQLDHADDEHWTSLGLPRVDVVADKSGIADLKRADLDRLAPEVRRAE